MLVKGCNWNFWGNFTPQQYFAGLQAMKQKGFTTLRLYVVNSLKQHSTTHYDGFWQAIKNSGLELIPTLFMSFEDTHELLTLSWDEQKKWIDYILDKIEEYGIKVNYVDLCGEPGIYEVSALRKVYDYAETRLSNYKITIGFAPTKKAVDVAKQLDDIIDVHAPHYYLGWWKNFEEWLSTWLSFNKPLLLGEWGLEACNPQEENDQYIFDEIMLNKFRNLNIRGFLGQLVWDWRDLDTKSYWGILRADGTPKKAFTLFP